MTTKIKNKKVKSKKAGKAIISKSVRDYGNEPFCVKKTERSRKFLEKHGFPDLEE